MEELIQQLNFKGFYYHHTVTPKPDTDNFAKHFHYLYEVIYVVKGEGYAIVEGSRHKFKPGSILIFRPREFHFVRIDENCPCYERYVVHFDENLVLKENISFLNLFNERPLGIRNSFTDSKNAVLDIFERMDSYLNLKEQTRTAAEKLVLNELVLMLYNKFYTDVIPLDSEETITKIANYINDNLTSPLSLDEIAARFFVSKYYLSHIFKKQTDMSVMEYIMRKRVLMAKQMIEKGAGAINTSIQCGFSDYSTFYREYKKYTGQIPGVDVKNAKNMV